MCNRQETVLPYRDQIAAIIAGQPGRADIQYHALYHSDLRPKADAIVALATVQSGDALALVRAMKPVEHMPREYQAGYRAALDDVRIGLGEDVIHAKQ